MGGWFAWLRLNVEWALEADFLRVVHSHVQEGSEVSELALHVGVEERGISFTPPPEGVAEPIEFFGAFQGFLHLRPSISVDVHVGRGSGTLRVAGVGEEAARAPEKLYPGLGLLFLELGNDGVEGLAGSLKIVELGGDVPVVPAVEFDSYLVEELKKDIHTFKGVFDRSGSVVPRHLCRATTERVCKFIAHDVPVSSSKTKVILHFFPADQFLGIVVLEGKGVFGAWALVLNFVAVEVCHWN